MSVRIPKQRAMNKKFKDKINDTPMLENMVRKTLLDVFSGTNNNLTEDGKFDRQKALQSMRNKYYTRQNQHQNTKQDDSDSDQEDTEARTRKQIMNKKKQYRKVLKKLEAKVGTVTTSEYLNQLQSYNSDQSNTYAKKIVDLYRKQNSLTTKNKLIDIGDELSELSDLSDLSD